MIARSKANGNVIHMSEEAAKVLVPGIYEKMPDNTPLTSSLTPPVPAPVVTTETARPRQTKRRKSG